jgi:hypothetical protein
VTFGHVVAHNEPTVFASGYKRTSSMLTGMTAFYPKADVTIAVIDVRL